MRIILRAGLAACAFLLLTGCFVSDTAFFSTSSAFYPFPAGAHYQRYEGNDEDGWKAAETGTLYLNGDWYSTTDDKGTASKPFIVISWGNYEIVEAQNGSGFIYDIIRIDGNTIYDYGTGCDDGDPDDFQSQGLVSHIGEDDDGYSTCTVTSPQALEQIFQHLLDGGMKPTSKYVLQN